MNFGDIHSSKVQAQIETYGIGARGFNLYDGSLRQAEFQGIMTHGDGAIGVQLSKPFGTIVVEQDIRTKGGEGDSLVRGPSQSACLEPQAGGKGKRTQGERASDRRKQRRPRLRFCGPC